MSRSPPSEDPADAHGGKDSGGAHFARAELLGERGGVDERYEDGEPGEPVCRDDEERSGPLHVRAPISKAVTVGTTRLPTLPPVVVIETAVPRSRVNHRTTVPLQGAQVALIPSPATSPSDSMRCQGSRT